MTRVAIYARVSTSNGSQDPQVQIRELREYAQRRELQIVEEYIDNGVSGSKNSRPALNRLMADAGRRRFDAVLVWKLDRFGRSLRHLVQRPGRTGGLGANLHQFAGQPGPEHAFRPTHVSDHRRHG
jgi:DNA invertase Pin-like site-specific DNA recombinase